MPFDVLNSIHRGRLASKIENDYRLLDDFRRPRIELIEAYAGDLYGESDRKRRKQLLPLMLQTAMAYAMAMAANNPRVAVGTKYRELRGFSIHYREAINNLITEIHLQETLAAVVLDAFFGPGLVKVCMGDSAPVMIENDVWMDPGRPYVGRVSLDDWCHDTGATDFRRCSYYLDRYRVPFEKLRDKELYDQKVAKTLTPTSKFDAGGDRAEEIGFGRQVDPDEVEPMIDLCDVYIPSLNQVITWVVDREMKLRNTDPLAVVDWEGPETGPYKMLNLGPVPDNVMPTAPGQNLKHLHDLLNSMMRKLDHSARNQKDFFVTRAGEEDMARKAREVPHLGIITTSGNPDHAFKSVSVNGPNAVMQNFALATQAQFDRFAGNLKMRLGLGQTFETATQEMMAKGEVDQSEAALMVKVLRLTEEICRDLGNMMFDDQAMTLPSSVPPLPGFERYGRLKSDWTPDYRQGRKTDYLLRVEPHSLQYQSPGQRAATLRTLWNELLPMAQVLGIQPDTREYLTLMSEYLDAPELLAIFPVSPLPGRIPEASEQGGMPFNPNKPNGNYTRNNVSRGGGAAGGNAEALTQLMQTAASGGGGGVAIQ